jgi:hypothetical protein
MKKIISLFLPLLLLLSNGCGEGITPEHDIDTAGFGGKITFIGEWPDSIKRTYVVVFERLLNSPADFNILNLKYAGVDIPFGVEMYNYNSLTDSSIISIEPGYHQYAAVIQSASPVLSFERKDWVVSGVYYAGGDTTHPGALVIHEDKFTDNINIICDFNNPPPQPPGGF